MTNTFALAAALTLFAATGAFAQAAQSSSGSTMMMKQGSAPKSDAAGMTAKPDNSADASADASADKPKAHHKMARNEAQLNEQEAETTKQLNQQQAQYTK